MTRGKNRCMRGTPPGSRRFLAREAGDRMLPVPDEAKISTINRACGL